MSGDLVTLTIEEQGGVVVARVAGELDLAAAPTMGDSIAAATPTSARALIVDFTELEFIDSSGVSMLFSLARRLGSRRQELRVVAPPGRTVVRVLEIVQLDRAAPLHSDLESALAEIG